MVKKVIISGILGGIFLFIWTFIVNGMLGFRHNVDMKDVPNERQVYEMLKENIVEPGRYVCNPGADAGGYFLNEPVFGITYGGVGHEAAGWLAVVGFIIMFFVPILSAALLSTASDKILASYTKRVIFIAVLGLLLAVFYDLSHFGIGSYPAKDALILAAYDVVTWSLMGAVIAWRMKPF